MPHRVSHATETTTSETGAETQWTRTCPLCEFEAAHHRTVYVHLQTSHRKSALAALVLDDTTAPE